MVNFYTVVAIIVVSLALIAAEPPRFRETRRFGALRGRNNHQFARQEAAPSAAPYPAAGVTPEIPFDLPDQTYGPPEPTPDKTYGPPEPTPDQTYGPPDDEPTVTEPDNTYGPPEDEQPAVEEAVPADAELVSQNIIQPRQKFVRSRSRSAPLRLRTAQPRGRFVEVIRSEPVLFYTLH